MKLLNRNFEVSMVLLVVFFPVVSCFSQVGLVTNTHAVAAAPVVFHPAISGLGSNDVVSAIAVSGSVVFFSQTSGEAILRGTTNGLCFYKGRLFFASSGEEEAVYINSSLPFGTNDFNSDTAMEFCARIKNSYYRFDSPYRKFISLKPVLEAEERIPQSMGFPVLHADLVVESSHLVLYFESYTHLKGKIVLDDQLNPISMVLTGDKDSDRN